MNDEFWPEPEDYDYVEDYDDPDGAANEYVMGPDGRLHLPEDDIFEEYGCYGGYLELANHELLYMFGGDIDALQHWLEDD